MGVAVRYADERAAQADEGAADRVVPLGYLRAFVTTLVVLHHTLLAYHPQAPKAGAFEGKSMIWSAFPVIDSERVPAFGIVTGMNDVFFMSLMFFISGLFVWESLTRKGAGAFLRDRIIRLGLPFAVAATVLAPFAYYPAYLQRGGAPDIASFMSTWTSLGSWPAGPAWFLWVLLAFDLVVVVLYAIAPRFGEALAWLSAGAGRRPFAYVCGLILVSGAGYLSMNLYLGFDKWAHWGPFFIQAGRALLYPTYFLAGVGVGAYGLSQGLLDPAGKLARRWWLWLPGGLMAYVALVAAFITAIGMKFQPQPAWTIALCSLFAIVCAMLSFSLVAIFLRFFKRPGPVFDSLSRNAYGIYLLHYAYATWLQYAFLHAPLSGLEKGGIVFGTTLILSWATTALLRSFPTIGRVI